MLEIKRKKTRIIKIGNVSIGGDYPIAIQAMAKTKTSEVEKTIEQIKELESAGAEIVRVAVKDKEDARAINKIKPNINIPLVADIHFDWRLALAAIQSGVDKIRLNPGNISKIDQIEEIVKAAKFASIPIRIGLNSGSVGDNTNLVDKMVLLCQQHIKILEGFGFYDIVISLKAQNILDTIEAYRRIAEFCDYPMHLGITATGPKFSGLIKSSIAIGTLLLDGIGNTIRISLTDRPQEEVRAAWCLLQSLGLRVFGPEIISCPTCGRCEVDLVSIVKNLEKRLSAMRYSFGRLRTLPRRIHPERSRRIYPERSQRTCPERSRRTLSGPSTRFTHSGSCPATSRDEMEVPLCAKLIKIAVMGCIVNGPGEARQADIGIAFGKKQGLLFKKGKAIKKVSAHRCVDVLLQEILRFV